jgi:hypothetical protein
MGRFSSKTFYSSFFTIWIVRLNFPASLPHQSLHSVKNHFIPIIINFTIKMKII